MSQHPHLNNAPITEALIDIRVQQSKDFDLDKLEDLHNEISSDYPKKKGVVSGEFSFKVDAEGHKVTPSASPTNKGFVFLNQEENRLVQVTADGFTFNMLSPYTNWEEMRDMASPLWNLYAKSSSCLKVTRLALRYINKMNFPLPITSFSDYLITPPTLPEALPQGVSSYLSRLIVQAPDVGARVIVTQAFEGTPIPEILPIILDIDAFKENEYDVFDDHIWGVFEELRVLKNDFFFENLTQKAIEVFK